MALSEEGVAYLQRLKEAIDWLEFEDCELMSGNGYWRLATTKGVVVEEDNEPLADMLIRAHRESKEDTDAK